MAHRGRVTWHESKGQMVLKTIAAVAVVSALVGAPAAPLGCPANWVARPDPTWPYHIGCYPPDPPPPPDGHFPPCNSVDPRFCPGWWN
jgi:hypothetical protein